MICLVRVAKLLDAGHLLANHCVVGVTAVEVCLAKVPIIAVGVLRLNDDGTNPGRSFAGVEFRRSQEFGVPATVGAFGEALYGSAQ
jgi:hypothetical protein